MASGEWHKVNDYLKSLIIENYVLIKHKDLKSQNCNHFIKFIILNNHDTLIQVEMEDSHIIYLDISSYCKSNFIYFDQLEGILDHSDISKSFILYLLNFNLSE